MLVPAPVVFPVVATRADLLALGLTPRDITLAVKSGILVRPRRDRYLPADASRAIVAAVRAGGRLTCTSVLAAAGLWVQDASHLHVHLDPSASRVRDPHTGKSVPRASTPRDFTLHWRPLVSTPEVSESAVGIVDAMIQAVTCQPPDFAIASLDSAVRCGLLSSLQLDLVFFHVPSRLQYLRELIDPRSESILESLFRLRLRRAHVPYQLQVTIAGVGRVDFVVAGRVVVETDGSSFHGEKTAERDYDRDLRLARLGYVVIRLSYRQVVFQPEFAIAAVLAAVSGHRPIRSNL